VIVEDELDAERGVAREGGSYCVHLGERVVWELLTSSACDAPMYRLLISIRRFARLIMLSSVALKSSGEARSEISSPRAPKHGWASERAELS
jgi:hypothetical protein